MQTFIRRLIEASRVFTSLIGRPCAVCREELNSDEEFICHRCLILLPRTYFWLAPNSSQQLSDVVSNGVAPPGFLASWFFYDANTPWANLIRQAKYNDRPRMAYSLARKFAKEMLAAGYKQPIGNVICISDIDVLLPVPMHWLKRIRRSYNQSDYIADGLSDVLNIPVGDNLVANRPHATQTHMSGQQRRKNLINKFVVEHPDELNGLNIAIVDDVVTTGATIIECINSISRSGAKPASISVLTLGITAAH